MKLGKEEEKNMLAIYGTYKNWYRSLRRSILSAFDVYKINVMYGIVEETEEKRNEILEWYSKVLQLDEDAIDNIPVEIKRYL